MQIKIIKRSERENDKNKIAAAEIAAPKNSDLRRNTAATIKVWIEDLRRKREGERLLIGKLFKEEISA